jgi:hypothetical protein
MTATEFNQWYMSFLKLDELQTPKEGNKGDGLIQSVEE